MAEYNSLKYLKNAGIDLRKWDDCIDRASNSRIYATSWFLERTAKRWDALVWNDYEYVMPLPVKKKVGLSYLYQPLYCQQLGIFPAPPAEIAREFYTALYRKFRYADIQLNSGNLPPKNTDLVSFSRRRNYLLHLNADFDAISAGFTQNTRRNIARAEKRNISYFENTTPEEFLAFKRSNLTGELSESGFQVLKSIIAYSLLHGFGKIAGAYSPENELCAAVFFCRWKNRVIYLNAVSSKEGKENRAMFLLLGRFFKNAAGHSLTLDFEGSMLPGIARFFEGFGATPEIYFRMSFNRLPFPLNLVKKVSE